MFIHERLLSLMLVGLVVILGLTIAAVIVAVFLKDYNRALRYMNGELSRENGDLRRENQKLYKLAFRKRINELSEGELFGKG